MYSSVEREEYDRRVNKGTSYDSKIYDVNIGTARIGDHSIDVYQKQKFNYKQDWTHTTWKIRCVCAYCGCEHAERKEKSEGEWEQI